MPKSVCLSVMGRRRRAKKGSFILNTADRQPGLVRTDDTLNLLCHFIGNWMIPHFVNLMFRIEGIFLSMSMLLSWTPCTFYANQIASFSPEGQCLRLLLIQKLILVGDLRKAAWGLLRSPAFFTNNLRLTSARCTGEASLIFLVSKHRLICNMTCLVSLVNLAWVQIFPGIGQRRYLRHGVDVYAHSTTIYVT